jgi:hypothetical protein
MTDASSELKSGLFVEVLRSFGEARLAVTGTSMLPSVRPGDVLEVHRESVAEVMPGEVVLFEREGRTLLLTRGDRLKDSDPPVSPEEVLGRVTAIVRGRRRISTRMTWQRRIACWALRRSDYAARAPLLLGTRDCA